MSLIRFTNQFPSLFDRFFENDMIDWSNRHFSDTNTTLPSVNIVEDSESFEVEVAAPGFGKDDFRIELDNNVLSISSDKKVENETKEGSRFTKKEFSYQSFRRSFTLPVTVENEKITAKYENGILNVFIPKKEEAKPKPIKQIAIS
ncbi:MAG: Hsp20/alpha crystallin family protein [Bacteroidales bacterium]|nr:Hsp20/alpha crystallin family protein [Bacteroidales bacterium]